MTAQIDLRGASTEQAREQLFEALDEADAGPAFDVVADDDVDPHLVRYQIERDRSRGRATIRTPNHGNST